jgi:Protein of unknown function (DUF2934)
MRKRHLNATPSTNKQTSTATPASPVAGNRPIHRQRGTTEDEIRVLAYHKWVSAGQPVGDGVQFWIAAEQELASVQPNR